MSKSRNKLIFTMARQSDSGGNEGHEWIQDLMNNSKDAENEKEPKEKRRRTESPIPPNDISETEWEFLNEVILSPQNEIATLVHDEDSSLFALNSDPEINRRTPVPSQYQDFSPSQFDVEYTLPGLPQVNNSSQDRATLCELQQSSPRSSNIDSPRNVDSIASTYGNSLCSSVAKKNKLSFISGMGQKEQKHAELGESPGADYVSPYSELESLPFTPQEDIQYTSSTHSHRSVDSAVSTSPQNSPANNAEKKRKSKFKSDIGKKRQKHSERWIDAKRKDLKNSGKEYVNRAGKVIKEKQLGPVCLNTCKLKCHKKFSQDVRKKIFLNFWALGDHSKQWEYIHKFSKKVIKSRKTTEGNSRRQYTTKYFLPLPIQNSDTYESVQVCLKTFCNTISVSDRFIRTAHSKSNQEGSVYLDNRGKHSNHPSKITETVKKSVCDHVLSFQPVESHYIRKDSSKLYLDNDLSIPKMFSLYETWDGLGKYDQRAETVRQYRDIVNENMNVAFFTPKKDICDKCHAFNSLTCHSEDEIIAHDIHINNKNTAREFKASDKLCAQSQSPKVVCASFDFQKILNVPHGDVGLFYYKRKLSMYNFTVFDMAKKEGFCYMWTECVAKRGANEVSSCLKMFIEDRISSGACDFRFWSDNCAGQNRNRIVYMAYMYLSQLFQIDITHRFLEKGHTQSEVDSVHALIEKESKGKMIYTPDQWNALVRWAKSSGQSYKVIEVPQDQVFDYKQLIESRNWKKSTTNENVKWNKIKEVYINKDEPNSLHFKYALQEDYQRLNTVIETRRGKKKTATNTELNVRYSDSLPIQTVKYKDLETLCKSNVIPKQYHKFYSDIKHGEVNSEEGA